MVESSMRKIKRDHPCAFIFDLDGTLLDSLSGIAESMNRVLKENGMPTHPNDAYRLMVGNGVAQLVERALPESLRHPGTIHEFITLYRRAYDEMWQYETAPFPLIPDLLNRLSQQELPFSVLSNKTHEVTCRMVSTLLHQFPFVDVLGQRDDIPIKPDPSAALTLSLLMGIEPESTFFVGDSAVDMETARNAGMIPIGVSWGMRPRQELILSGAQTVIDEPLELLDLFPG